MGNCFDGVCCSSMIFCSRADNVRMRGGDILRFRHVRGEVIKLGSRRGRLLRRAKEPAMKQFPIAHADGLLAARAEELAIEKRPRRLRLAQERGGEADAVAGFRSQILLRR